MTVNTRTFEELRLNAASEFAQTMLVVDDEASQELETRSSEPAGNLRHPDRRTHSATTAADVSVKDTKSEKPRKHLLDAKLLIDNAMELGLICSVLRPKKGENFQDRVVRAAQVADIVCLDWEIYNDGGVTASRIIAGILREDAEQSGRLRLITIYTGDMTNIKILDKIFNSIPKSLKDEHAFKKGSWEIESKNGVKIVCLFKTHGIQLPAPRNANQVGEDQLPKRLQIEFAKLAEGLLSNVALATIASIRKSTHHVLSKFTGQMDGPFFHHRVLLDNPEDAEEYAVDIVLSELKGAIDKQQVAVNHAGPKAIDARIREMAGDESKLKLKYENNGKLDTFELEVDVSIKMITNGLSCILKEARPPNSPGRKKFESCFSTLFSDSHKTARSSMHEFAALTGVRSYPGSHLYNSHELFPKLGLGTIIRRGETYLMCLQASCDSVRIEGEKSFLFVPLCREDTKPEHVVPILSNNNKWDFIGLSTPKESYNVVQAIKFSASAETQTVNAIRIIRRRGLYFKNTKGRNYLWIADLKRSRALRTVQRLGQNMGRLGFDEFEPYRQRDE